MEELIAAGFAQEEAQGFMAELMWQFPMDNADNCFLAREAETYFSRHSEIIDKRYALCNRIRRDLQYVMRQLHMAHLVVFEGLWSRKPSFASAARSCIVSSVMEHVGRYSFFELPALRCTSRAITVVVADLANDIPYLYAPIANEFLSKCVAELEVGDLECIWEEPDTHTFGTYIPGEAHARKMCTLFAIHRVWSFVPGMGHLIQQGGPYLQEVLTWMEQNRSALRASHPEGMAFRLELAEMFAAMGDLQKGIDAVHSMLNSVRAEIDSWCPQTQREVEFAHRFLDRPPHPRTYYIDHRSIACTRAKTEALENNGFPEQEAIAEVIQEVQHDDDGAVIPVTEAECTAAILWASSVERLASRAANEEVPYVLITFSRHCAALQQAILASPIVSSLTISGVDVQPQWANGAFVLASIQKEDIDFEFHPRHVLVADENVLLSLLAALEHLPYMQRKLKPNGLSKFSDAIAPWEAVSSLGSSSSSAASPDEELIDFTYVQFPVRRTFIHYDEQRLDPRARSV